ncbi:MAG: endonuclease/exonuclease/phosphatase family protein [Phycisphaerae bacterium]|nr:endonuclease/exonuclease/phosphatase family protein [Phycisphaerae bacterium]MDW8261998.1 endonuclease/exonuclease/phosphatase family protein [Phycisphaerales bacterium]
MRVVSYNILDGGEGRADPLAEVLLAQRADLIALIEADNPQVLARIAARLGMDYVVAEGERHAVALLARYPMESTINHAVLRTSGPDCFLEAEVTTPPRGKLVVGVLHLHPRADESDEHRREQQLRLVLEVFAPRRRQNQAHLLLGDFNANSPVQEIDPQRCKKATRESWHRNGGQLPRRAIQMLLDAGYLDTLAVARPDQARSTGSFTTQHPGQRVDYIFTWGFKSEDIRDAWIEQDRLAKYSSDHFPVGCELR